MITLATYMTENGLSPEGMAKRLGCSEGAVRKWIYGERIPSPDWLRTIAECTDGRVTPNDFLLPAAPPPEAGGGA